MLNPVDIRKVWKVVEPMLSALLDKNEQDSKPVDVYTVCVNEQATLFMPEDNSGLLVVTVKINQFTSERYLFVWMACHKDSNAQDVYSAEIEEIGRSHGCSYIEFESKRRGFERRGDWEMMNTTFRKRLQESV